MTRATPTAVAPPIGANPLETVDDAQASARYAFTVVGLMAAAQIMSQVDRAVMAVGAADIMRDLGLTPERYGVLASAFYSLHAITGIVIGLVLAHRIRPLLLVIGMVGIWTVTQLPPIFLPTFATLLVSRVVLGAAEAPGMPAAVAATHELFPTERRSVPTSIVWVGAMVGALIAPPALTAVMSRYGWQSGFAASAALSFALFVALAVVSRRNAHHHRSAAAPPATGTAEPPVRIAYWRNGRVVALTLVGFSAYWMTAFSGSWLFPMVHLHWGYGRTEAGWVTSAVFMLCAVMLLASSALAQHLARRGLPLRWAVMAPATGCLLLGSSLLALSAALPQGLIKLAFIAIGISLMPVVGATLSVVISGIVPAADRNRLLVVILALTSLAGLPAPYVTGWLIGRLGDGGYDAALVLCGAVTFAGGLLAVGLLRKDALRPLSAV